MFRKRLKGIFPQEKKKKKRRNKEKKKKKIGKEKKKKVRIGRGEWGGLKCSISFLVLIGCLFSHLMVPFLMEINFKTQSPWMEFMGVSPRPFALKLSNLLPTPA